MEINNQTIAIAGVLIVTLAAVFVVARVMKGGFGPNNIRVFGIVLIACFTTILALITANGVSSAFGILGAIAGYLFGVSSGGNARGSNDG
ncbi:hypothetical protein [Halomonas sp. KO116]|uniref:hypothetical protein n=1 Tax=Halomonas sp. KO116 TaxID=1504981 RepID=UPI0004E3ED05|nr:hypothetical protein [Halomonas sp. KO116]AJY50446.1 hypothetical protein KO116_01967 [Halomonas sp. KO116]